jgi:hypothetical protein
MAAVTCCIAALTVVCIYYVWRAYLETMAKREQTLRERVTYMLWVMSHKTR